MSIVSNATPIISLAGIKRIGLLFELFETVKPLLDGMISNGRSYSDQVYAAYLRKIGE